MDVFKISVKFFVEDASSIGGHDFVPIFHSWIQQQAVADHTLIDVADYAHVHNGPGTVLIAHEANFYTDRTDGQLGLTYSRKTPAGETLFDRLCQAYVGALEACARLEETGKVIFRTDESAIRFNDRLLAPNSPQTFNEAKPDIERLAAQLYGDSAVDIEHYFSQNLLFEVRVRGSDSPGVETLLHRLR